MIGKLEPAGTPASRFSGNKGRLPWPALGPVDVAFGQQIEREFGTVTTQNGYDIRAPAGTRVQAVFAGRVVYADWLRGYGRLVIIDHGEGYHTLYAHLGTAVVQRGDAVAQGTEIGTVGDTGSLRGTFLYFEIRDKSVPVDPKLWLR
jgi:septal ring factor EnvC (AmiA/AmiB activator)